MECTSNAIYTLLLGLKTITLTIWKVAERDLLFDPLELSYLTILCGSVWY
jgi:hypothetical protein